MQTNYQYYKSNPEIVDRVLDKLADTTIADLEANIQSGKKNTWPFVTNTIADVEHIDSKDMGRMTYKELAAIVSQIDRKSKYQDCENEQLFDYMMFYTMLKVCELPAVRRFMSMPYECLAEAVFRRGIGIDLLGYHRFNRKADKEKTVREKIDEHFDNSRGVYNPLTDGKTYIRNIKREYTVIGDILVDAFAHIYACDCSYSSVIRRYTAKDDIDGYCEREVDDEELFD